MHELQPWHKSMAEVKGRTMYFSYSISLTYNIQFTPINRPQATFIPLKQSHIGTFQLY